MAHSFGASRPARLTAAEIEADIHAELEAHLELATSENIAAGMTPDHARREAEERFGNFEEVFGACRTEKLKERIMLQRILILLVFVLTVAVVAQAYQAHESQMQTERALEDVAAITRRIEERFDAAFLLGGLEEKRDEPRSEEPAEPDQASLRSRWMEQIDALRTEQERGGYRPSHPRWRQLQDEIEDYEQRLGRPEAPSNALDTTPSIIEHWSNVLRSDGDPAARFEAVQRLGNLAKSGDGDPETPLRPMATVQATDPGIPSLCFFKTVNSEGNLEISELGFVPVTGLTLSEVEVLLQERLEEYYETVDIQVSKEAWDFAALIGALGDTDVFVRLSAVRTLGEIGDPRALKALLRVAVEDEMPVVSEEAERAARSSR